jgi:diguanylate cyclase (GGDEF)-like protein
VAQQLQESVRSYDICARYGGDEFVVMLPGCGAEDAQRKAATLQRAVSQLKCEPKLGVTEPLRISAGVAVFPSDGETFEQLLTVADGRMFQDKAARTGRTAATVEESASVVAFRPRLQT